MPSLSACLRLPWLHRPPHSPSASTGNSPTQGFVHAVAVAVAISGRDAVATANAAFVRTLPQGCLQTGPRHRRLVVADAFAVGLCNAKAKLVTDARLRRRRTMPSLSACLAVHRTRFEWCKGCLRCHKCASRNLRPGCRHRTVRRTRQGRCHRSRSLLLGCRRNRIRNDPHRSSIQFCTRTVVLRGRRIKVARIEIGATEHFELIAKPIAVGVIQTVSVAVEVFVGIHAVVPVFRGFGVVVASGFVHATGDFKFVADAVAVRVVHAGPIAVKREVGVFAGAIFKQRGVVVAHSRLARDEAVATVASAL